MSRVFQIGRTGQDRQGKGRAVRRFAMHIDCARQISLLESVCADRSTALPAIIALGGAGASWHNRRLQTRCYYGLNLMEIQSRETCQ